MRLTAACIVVLGAIALAGISFAAEETATYGGPWHGWHWHMPGFWWICPLMMMIMFVFFLYFFSRGRGHRGRWMREYPGRRHTHERDQSAAPEAALDILNKRYARGEIDKADYEERKITILSSNE